MQGGGTGRNAREIGEGRKKADERSAVFLH